MGVNSLPKTVTRQRRGCDLNPGPSASESSTRTTRLRSHLHSVEVCYFINISLGGFSGTECSKIRFRLRPGSAPDPWGNYDAPPGRSPDEQKRGYPSPFSFSLNAPGVTMSSPVFIRDHLATVFTDNSRMKLYSLVRLTILLSLILFVPTIVSMLY